MLFLHCTQKLRDRLKCEVVESGASTTRLGSWYATILPGRPQVVLLVNERTLLPVLMPLVPAVSFAHRFPGFLAHLLTSHGVPLSFIKQELSTMRDVGFTKTQNRSVVGVMTEFSHIVESFRDRGEADDLLALSLALSRVPCGPLYKSPVFPDKALVEIVSQGTLQVVQGKVYSSKTPL